jgi:hypothetical protein
MRILTRLCVTVIFVMSLATGALAASEPAANGNVQVDAGDEVIRDVNFNVKIENDGSTKGDMTFVDPSVTADFDPDNADAGNPVGLAMRVEFDCLVVQGNRAVMGGVVTESNLADRIKQRVLLVAEDNGEGSEAPAPDRLGWGVYSDHRRTWTPADAEVPGDLGATFSWLATDAERDDDVGVPTGEPITQSQVVDCASFPASAYALVNIEHGDGNIQIKE